LRYTTVRVACPAQRAARRTVFGDYLSFVWAEQIVAVSAVILRTLTEELSWLNKK
jgi:hypothetical protein